MLTMADSKPQLFGTDGVRGRAGAFPLDPRTLAKLGRAIARVLRRRSAEPRLRVVLGQDTRESGDWIARELAGGFRAENVDVVSAGVITTPGIAYLTRRGGFAAGVVISASHNPYEDNGVKVLAATGMKLAESAEVEIERELASLESAIGEPPAPLDPRPELLDDYLDFLAGLLPPALRPRADGLVLDCAHGAASRVVPRLLEWLGIQARVLNAAPNGRNINVDCGSLYPEGMAAETRARGAALGVAFDGDADRAIFATREGRIADGDHVLYAAAKFLHARGQLKGGAVVGTLMTNLGLELALQRLGIGLKRTPVGDKYVLEEMLRSGANLGGEPSGHIIFSDVSLAGDGLVTWLEVLRLVAETGRPFGELVADLRQCPQIITNVRVREKPPLSSISTVAEVIAECEREFAGRGRVVVRYSGTERLARVMVEAEDAAAVDRHAARIAAAIREALGAE
jgi:phosphoglucosamine mutase